MITGYNSHRLVQNDPYHKKEIDFVNAFNKEMELNHNFINQIINHPSQYLEDDQQKIVLTVIQWLGTPVGQYFIDKVNKL